MKSIYKIKEKSNSYLTFTIGDETFASHVMHVKNILEVPEITKIPKVSTFIKGIVNLRGEVLPIMDLYQVFGLGDIKFSANSCVLVVDIMFEKNLLQIGVLVDSVQEVLEIEEKNILPPPNIKGKIEAEFITGILNSNGSIIMILDMNKILTIQEHETLSASIKEINQSMTNVVTE